MTLGARILCFVIRERTVYRHEIIGVTLYAAALIVAEAYGYGYLTGMQNPQPKLTIADIIRDMPGDKNAPVAVFRGSYAE